MRPAIAIAAYNRPHTLRRLLGALSRAAIPQGTTTLIISIDRGGQHQAAVKALSESYPWPYGDKHIVLQEEHLGLVEHIMHCGDYAQEYGSVIRLEDDHMPGRRFYTFARQALAFYAHDERIAGIALYAPWFNGFTHTPFMPLLDASDTYFMQNPWSHGQAYTAAQWADFRAWWAQNDHTITPAAGLHEVYAQFPPTDWFPAATKYLVEQNKYVVFPRESHTTHFGDVGTHFERPTRFYQVPLQQHKTRYQFLPLADATAVYDAFQELSPMTLKRLAPTLADYALTVDLNATKSRPNTPTEWVLTTRPVHKAERAYGKVMLPLAANVIEGIAGEEINLAHREDVRYAAWLQAAAQADNANHYARYYQFSRRKRLMLWLAQRLHIF